MKDQIIQLTHYITQKIFGTMVSMTPVYNQYFNEVDVAMIGDKFIGVMDLTGQLVGAFFMHCPRQVATWITQNMLMIEYTEIPSDEQIKDAIGEVVNMTSGNLKSSLSGAGIKTKVSIPTVYSGVGGDFKVMIAGAERLVIPYLIGEYPFWIEVLYNVNHDFRGFESFGIVEGPLERGKGVTGGLNVQFINPFLESFKTVFEQMTKISLIYGKLNLKKPPLLTDDVSVHIAITGDLTGKVIFSFNETVAKIIASGMMMGKTVDILDEITMSAISEFCNMISAHSCASLLNERYKCYSSSPNLIKLKNIQIQVLDTSIKILNVPLVFSNDPYKSVSIDIILKESLEGYKPASVRKS